MYPCTLKVKSVFMFLTFLVTLLTYDGFLNGISFY